MRGLHNQLLQELYILGFMKRYSEVASHAVAQERSIVSGGGRMSPSYRQTANWSATAFQLALAHELCIKRFIGMSGMI